MPAWLQFAQGSVLTAHNAPFDLGFLTAACGACGLPWPDFAVLDTVAVARQVLVPGEVPDCKLGTLAAYFETPAAPSHRALADARATAAVLDVLITRLAAARCPHPGRPQQLAFGTLSPAQTQRSSTGRRQPWSLRSCW